MAAIRIEIILYSEHIETPKGLVVDEANAPLTLDKTLECRLVIDPLTAKLIAQVINNQISKLENQYGVILTGQEQQQVSETVTQTDKKTTTGGIG